MCIFSIKLIKISALNWRGIWGHWIQLKLSLFSAIAAVSRSRSFSSAHTSRQTAAGWPSTSDAAQTAAGRQCSSDAHALLQLRGSRPSRKTSWFYISGCAQGQQQPAADSTSWYCSVSVDVIFGFFGQYILVWVAFFEIMCFFDGQSWWKCFSNDFRSYGLKVPFDPTLAPPVHATHSYKECYETTEGPLFITFL